MKYLPAEINLYGLALPPTSTDCLGEECDITRKDGRCFSDRHHLYFYKERFNADGPKSLAYKLRQDPFNIIWIARCRHNNIHQTHEGPYIPGVDVMARFLEEAELLRELGVSAIRLASLELDLDFDNNFKPYATKDAKWQWLPELIERQRAKVSDLGELATIIEVVPPEFTSNPFRVAYRNAPPDVVQHAAKHLASIQQLAA
ncbi:MAG: hypothetical protein ACYCPS_03475 [Candidatus Saccharimonadales bacterium]